LKRSSRAIVSCNDRRDGKSDGLLIRRHGPTFSVTSLLRGVRRERIEKHSHSPVTLARCMRARRACRPGPATPEQDIEEIRP
jgi:hypothetical protein